MTDIAMSMAQEQIKELKADNERLTALHIAAAARAEVAQIENERLNGVNTVLCNRYAEIKTDNERLKAIIKAHEADNELRYFGEVPL